jgi:nucleotidyltransferase/DNA polymerase involved in DNA repair
MEGVLKQSGVESVGDLRNLTLDHLCRMFGERLAKFMYQACKGYDNTPVRDKGPCKSISVEDSFRNCTTLQQVEIIMWQLAPDLVSRLDEDKADTARTPKRFTVKWRTKSIM